MLKEKVGTIFVLTGTGKNFLSRNPVTYTLAPIIDKWDLMKLKHVCPAKDTIIYVQKQPQNGKTIFTAQSMVPVMDKELKN